MRIKVIELIVLAAILLVCAGLIGLIFPLDVIWTLLTGWCFYLARVVPEVKVSGNGIATALTCALLLTFGAHKFLSWLWMNRRNSEGTLVQAKRAWSLPSTLGLFGCRLASLRRRHCGGRRWPPNGVAGYVTRPAPQRWA